MELLFSYGTLQFKKVQKETYGRILNGKKDFLLGFKLGKVKITDPVVLNKSQEKFHPIAIPTQDSNKIIEGVVFEITTEELEATDKYEVSDYKRVKAQLKSGMNCWVYISRN